MLHAIPAMPVFPTPAPDWSSFQAEIHCPLCEYNLRGLTEPRCPECGFAFDWNELLNSELHRHPYLFEHQTKRKLRSFWKTYWRNALPGRFWREVSPVQTVFPGRLLIYWLIANSFALMLLIVPLVLSAVDTARSNAASRALWTPLVGGVNYTYSGPSPSWNLQPSGTRFRRSAVAGISAAQLNKNFPPTLSLEFVRQVWNSSPWDGTFGLAILLLVLWPWLTLLSLLFCFQISMKRAKIKDSHILRCVIYGCDFGFLAIAFLIFLRMHGARHDVILYALSAYAILTLYRLTFAYKRYLRFHLPFFTILASQVIVILFVLTALVSVFL
jgi:hypothetical protein